MNLIVSVPVDSTGFIPAWIRILNLPELDLHLLKYKSGLKKLKQLVYVSVVLQLALIIGIMSSSAAGKTIPSSDTSRHIRSFIVTDATGRRTDVALQKNKVIFINFWALTCIPCKTEMPTINYLANHYKNDTNFLVMPVDLDHNFPEDVRYFHEKNFTLTVYTPSGVVPRTLFKGVLPTTVVIDKKGDIVLLRQEEGKYDTSSFFQFADSLLRQ